MTEANRVLSAILVRREFLSPYAVAREASFHLSCKSDDTHVLVCTARERKRTKERKKERKKRSSLSVRHRSIDITLAARDDQRNIYRTLSPGWILSMNKSPIPPIAS